MMSDDCVPDPKLPQSDRKPPWGPDLWDSQLGPISPVDPDDLRKMWAFMLENQDSKAIGIEIFKSICSAGADVLAVWYRASVLKLCEHVGLLSRWRNDGRLDDAVITVAADFPMDKMEAGVVHKALPLDVEEFLKRIDAESAKTKP